MEKRAMFYRRNHGGRFTVFAFLVLAALALPAAAKNKWLYARTEHFEVLSNAKAVEARLLVARLERFRASFLAIMPGTPFREPRTTVVIFDSDRDFLPYKPLYKGKPQEDIAGVFQGNPDEVVIALSAQRDIDETIPVVYHEYIHLLMHARGFRLPPWLNEGLAELYETMEFEGNVVKIGRDSPYHVGLLSRSRLMPLAQLFAVSQISPDYNETNRRSIFYAESWALLHYCLTARVKGRQVGEGFDRLLTLMQLGYSPEECMQAAYGLGLDDMEEELGAHIRGGRYVLKNYTLPAVDYAAGVVFRPATDFEREVALVNLQWHIQRKGDATYRLLELAEHYPASPRPHEVLAAIAASEGERKRAIDCWTTAAGLQTSNPYVYAKLAEDSLRQYLAGANLNFRLSEAATKELRGWLDRAIVLDPGYAEAWDWLALTEAYARKPRQSMVTQLLAQRQIFGNRPRLLAGFAVIALRINNTDFAENLADALLAMPSVMRVPDRRRTISSLAVGLSGGNAMSWALQPEYYPDVRAIAKAVKNRVKPNPAGDDDSAPVEFELSGY
jgi:tetratricopeptide (TPR) repeat protein